MRLGSMMFRTLITTILASVLTLIAELVLSLLVTTDSPTVIKFISILLALFSSAAFATILTYLLQVYHGSGETEVWEEYPEKYNGIIKDIPLVIKKERYTLLFIFTLGAIDLVLRAFNANLLKSSVLNTVLSIFTPITALSSIFPVDTPTWVSAGRLAGAFTTCLLYVIIFALFRWKWRRFM